MAFEMNGPTFFKKISPIRGELKVNHEEVDVENVKQDEITDNMGDIMDQGVQGLQEEGNEEGSWWDRLTGGSIRQEQEEGDVPLESAATDYAMGSPEWHKARRLKIQKEDLLG